MSGKSQATIGRMLRVVGFYDISRAHFHSPVRRNVFIAHPKEDREVTGIARLLKAMYGTRDAAQCFDTFAETSMQKLGFTVGVFNPCIYWNEEKDLVCVRHGDDFTVRCTRSTNVVS